MALLVMDDTGVIFCYPLFLHMHNSPFYLTAALDVPLARNFIYLSKDFVEAGCRVMVPFGPQRKIAVVLNCSQQTDSKLDKTKLKFVAAILDKNPIYSAHLLSFAKFVSSYYLSPIGEVLKSFLPSSMILRNKKVLKINPKTVPDIEYETFYKEVFKEQSFISRKDLGELLKQKKKNKFLPKNLKPTDLIKIWSLQNGSIRSPEVQLSSGEIIIPKPIGKGCQDFFPLKDFQKVAFKEIATGDPRPILLHGITGSGKTEIYFHLIREILKSSGQALVLVPEISLTPQLYDRFALRFGDQVELVHSNLDDKVRFHRLDNLRTGKKSILIGPRSCVFASFRDLKFIVVDEEHDSSFKQAHNPCYQARDCAVYRAHLLKIKIVLGSATPSLESFYNAKIGKYSYVQMKSRSNETKALPIILSEKEIKGSPVQDLGKDLFLNKDKPDLLNAELKSALKKCLDEKGQAIIIVNRRGFSHFLFSKVDKETVKCPNCLVSLTIHKINRALRCHYCEYRSSLNSFFRTRSQKDFLAVGFGSENAEDSLKEAFPGVQVARLDSDVTSKKGALSKVLKEFREQKTRVLVGTQMLAKGHDFPKVTCVLLLDVDKQLAYPDFRSGERFFQLVVQAAGRAGRSKYPGVVYLQASDTNKKVFEYAKNQDYENFAKDELRARQRYGFPPFKARVEVEFSDTNLSRLNAELVRFRDELLRLENSAEQLEVESQGPLVPAIAMIAKRHRRQFVFTADDKKNLQVYLRELVSKFKLKASPIRMKIDVDP